MNKHCLLATGFLLISSAFVFSSQAIEKPVYKWEKDGEVFYGHIMPAGVKDFVKLDKEGRKIEEFTEDFDEIIELKRDVPDTVAEKKTEEADADADDPKKAMSAKMAEQRRQEERKENCRIAKQNQATLAKGEVYRPDAKGNMMRLSKEEVESSRKKVKKDIQYFCSD